MRSLRELYRIGVGPSASHTMGPRRAAEQFRARYPDAPAYRVTLFGSLAATGVGHLTDVAIQQAFAPTPIELQWRPEETLPLHPNGMRFEALQDDTVVACWEVYSVGGGALRDAESATAESGLYPLTTMQALLVWTARTGRPLWAYVAEVEGEEIWEHLAAVWRTMQAAVARGIRTQGSLPGPLAVPRKAPSYAVKAQLFKPELAATGRLWAYALGVAEENAAGGEVVAAPTCGSCGVVPAVLYALNDSLHLADEAILHALATAGLVGNLVKHNASISGAEVGCQGEIGTACAMAAAAAAQLLGGTPQQIEYAAEMGIEHHLGLTCDPVAGYVQIPCIERNAFAASRAVDCAEYALLSDGVHQIGFDEVVETLRETGADLQQGYRETSTKGLARVHRQRVPLPAE